MNTPQIDALRDQFAVALAQGFEIWRWTRGRDEDGLPAPTASEAVARDLWRQADLLVATRPATTTPFEPCPACGWRTFIVAQKHQVCLRCDTVRDFKPKVRR